MQPARDSEYECSPVKYGLSLKTQLAVKRALDLFFSVFFALFGLPFLGLIALLVRLDSSGPALIRQVRTGENMNSFVMYKFRSMRVGSPFVGNRDGSAYVDEHDPRVTRIGRIIRKYGIDELPQLWNIIRGQMSIVGPRPEQPHQTRMMPEWALAKLRLRPGLTSLAQVNGRNQLPWHQRLRLDLYYVEHYSLALDLQILLRTIPVVFLGKGVYSLPCFRDSSLNETQSRVRAIRIIAECQSESDS